MGGIRAMNGEFRPRPRDNLLLLGTSKLAENGLIDRSWRLNCQGVHKHVRGGRHGGRSQRRLANESELIEDKSAQSHSAINALPDSVEPLDEIDEREREV